MSDGCGLCRKSFSMIFRRPHRCRACGGYFCQSCSPHTLPTKGALSPPERVCGRCYVRLLDSAHGDAHSTTARNAQEEVDAPVLSAYAALEADPALDKYFRFMRFPP